MSKATDIGRRLNLIAAVSPRLAGLLAFPSVLRTGPRQPVRPAEQPVHDQAVTDHLVVHNKRLAVYQWGEDERKVLFMHGFYGRSSSMAGFIAGVRQLNMTAVAFDSFGHGDSEGHQATIVEMAAAVRAMEEKHGPFHAIVAHSFGALCAFHAVRSGVAVDRMAVIASICDFDYVIDLFCGRLGLRPSLKTDLRRRSERFFHPITDIWNRFSATYQAEDLTIPLLVIHDENDKEIAVTQGRKLASAYPQAQYVETQGLGHRRILGDPGVLATTLEFLAK
jgi:pimeloyl-ACP methyl ester carboxylesterase